MKRLLKAFFTTNFTKAFGLSGLILAAATMSAVAQKKYETGVTDTEIKIGNIMPYSGPASAYGIIGKTMSAYMRMINDNGGFPMTTPTARQRRWSRRESWSRATRYS